MVLNKKIRIFLAIASFMMVLAISLGAFGAHALKAILSEPMLKIYNTGIEYHFYNTLGLFCAIFIYSLKPESKKVLISLLLILIGMIIFSFSLYSLSILNMPILGVITPIGGSLLIFAWLIIFYAILKDWTMKTLTILGTGWLGFELARILKESYKIKVSSRNEEKLELYRKEGFSPYILNEEKFDFLDNLLDTEYLFINFPPSKFYNYLFFLNKIYNHEKLKDIKKIIFISSTSVYPNIEGYFNEDYKIEESSSEMVFEAEKLIKEKSNIIFRVAGLVGAERYFGKRSANKFIEFPNTPINFIHRNDIINATKFVIQNDISGIFNLCSNEYPTKKEIYSFNSRKYNFELPIFSQNEVFLNRKIDGSKIERTGFRYSFTNPFEF